MQDVSRSWVRVRLEDFDIEPIVTKIGMLAESTESAGFTTTFNKQISSWRSELEYLAKEIQQLIDRIPQSRTWSLLLEYEIPRRSRRIDAVLLAETVVFSIEFKILTCKPQRQDLYQAEDYALDLRDFHAESAGRPIIPVLVCTGTHSGSEYIPGAVLGVNVIGKSGFAERIVELFHSKHDDQAPPIDPEQWDCSRYRPTPGIIEATQHLFSTHTVQDIASSSAANLTVTLDAIRNAIEQSREKHLRSICFVTGVPGAGKTLVGLSAVGSTSLSAVGSGGARGAYLSGNSPLVRVLREAIARDSVSRVGTMAEARRRSRTLIQEVHQFVEEYGVRRRSLPPDEHVVIYDEAQRAWHYDKLLKRHEEAVASEPGLMLDIMSRPQDWSVLIALVGGGQEIHSGEAGLAEWGRAIEQSSVDWNVIVSPEVISGGASVSSHQLFEDGIPTRIRINQDKSMHLAVSTRSPRAEHLAQWVDHVLNRDFDAARKSLRGIRGFRMGLTRDIHIARQWLGDVSRGEFRPGLVASSGAARLRAEGVEMAPGFLEGYPIEHWFLGGPEDVRSSFALEVAMSEFKIQGLELDYIGMCWGSDLTLKLDGNWGMRRFRGSKWTAINQELDRRYLINKYRVLLTRAREGMIIWVPKGSLEDRTRDPEPLNRVADALLASGLELLE